MSNTAPPRQGKTIALKAILNHTPAQDLVLRLFVNDHEPGPDSSESSFKEADFPGYQYFVLAGRDWDIQEGETVEAIHPRRIFMRSVTGVPQTVYGYYLTQRFSGKYVAGERFLDPVVMRTMDSDIKVTPRIVMEG